jgi:mono/diheme cytochrome c family protein
VKKTWGALTALAMLSGMVICVSAVPRRSMPETTANQSEIERGRYLAEEIAKCSECHTARNEQGELRQDSWLRGAPIWIQPNRANTKLGRSRPRAGRPAKLHGRAGRKGLRTGDRTRRRSLATSNAHLPYESRGC